MLIKFFRSRFRINIIWKIFFSVLMTVPFFFTSPASAEGSRELVANGGHRPYLGFSPKKNAGIVLKTTIKVFVNAGEKVNLGSSVPNSANEPADIVYRWSEGGSQASDSCDISENGFALIDTVAKEKAGPLPKNGGYEPCTFIAPETGLYEIEFHAPLFVGGAKFPIPVAVSDPFPTDIEGQKTWVAAWDVTVFDTEGVEQTGRAYVNYLPLNVGKKGKPLNSKVFFLTNTGYLYRANLNGIDPHGFIFFANNKGFKDKNGNSLFQSVNKGDLTVDLNDKEKTVFLHDPNLADTNTDITHKLFFNIPASTLPASAKLPDGTETWLLSTPQEPPKVTDFKFTGKEGTPNQAGTAPLEGEFSFNTDTPGNYLLTIDINNNGIYGDENDRVLKGQMVTGNNTSTWDGLDGNGTSLLPQAVPYDAHISIIAGDVHFPFIDVENISNGLIIEQVNCEPHPCQVEDSTVYYNHSSINDGKGTPPNPIAALNGIDSSTGSQIFTGNFGDNKAIETWTSLVKPLKLDGGIQLKKADLSVSKTHSTILPPTPGGPITYTIMVKNSGPSDVAGIKVQDNLPATITEPFWTCEVSDSTTPPPAIQNHCATTNVDGAIDTTVDLQNGATATFTLSGKIIDSAQMEDTIDNSVTITRPNDVTNPQGTTADVKSETATDTVTLVPPDNKSPEAIDKTATTDNETTLQLPALEATDEDGTVESYKVFNIPSESQGLLYLGDPATGQLVTEGQTLSPAQIAQLYFKPNSNFSGDVVFNYTATDDKGAVSEPATVTITVTTSPQNIPPTADDKNAESIPNDTTARLPALSGTDDDGTVESYTIKTLPPATEGILYLGDPAEGGTQILAGRVLTPNEIANIFLQPKAGFTNTTNFTYTATDNQGAESPVATVTIPVSASNQPPQAIDKQAPATSNHITEQLPALEATDTDGTITSYRVETLPPASEGVIYIEDPAKGGKPVFAGQTLTPAEADSLFFKPNHDFSGSSSFTYTATDNQGAISNIATVTIPVTEPPNDPPIANDNSANTDPNQPVTIALLTNDSDPDDNLDAGSVTITQQPSKGTVTINPTTGEVTYTPAPSFTDGTDTFTYQVCDSGTPPLCDTAEVTVTVPSQLPPVADDKEANSTLNTTAVKLPHLSATDEDGTVVSYTIATLPLPGQGILYLGDPSDGGELVTEGQTLQPDQVGNLFFQPNSKFVDTASFTYTATDNLGAVSSPALVTIPVTAPVNTRPVANDDSVNTNPDTPVTISILDNDSDPEGSLDLDTITMTAEPSNGKVTLNEDGTVTYSPNSGFTNGTDVFAYQVCDSGIPQQCDSAIVTVTVPISGNQPPVANKQTEPSTPNNTTVPLSPLSATDSDGTVTAYTITKILPASQGVLYLGNPTEDGKAITNGQTLSLTDINNLFFQPNDSFTGNASFTFTATDDQDAVSNEALVTIPVTEAPPNQPPTATDDSTSTDPETPVTIAVLKNDSDPENGFDTDNLSIITDPSNGIVIVNDDGTVTYTPNPGFTIGSDTFIYQACDLGSPQECDTAVVTVIVPILTDPPPVADNQTVPKITNDSPAQLPALTANDNGTVVSYTIKDLPPANQGILYLGDPAAGGTPIQPGQVLTPEQAAQLFFQPKPDFTGNANFTYTATDNQGGISSPGLVKIPVTAPANSSPVVNDYSASTDPNTPVTIALLKNDSDPNGNIDPSSVTILELPTNGTVTINPDGTVTYTPNPDFITGTDIFSYQVCDTGNPVFCDTAFVEVTVPIPAEPQTPPSLTAVDLLVAIEGNGDVRSHPIGIQCHPENTPCSHTYDTNTEVTLTPTPDFGWEFEGWRGHCDHAGNVLMDATKQCMAIFVEDNLSQVNLGVARSGSGTIKSQPTGIECGNDCTEKYVDGSQIELTAIPEPGHSFVDWSGDCSGTTPTITVTVTEGMRCQANFRPDDDNDGAATIVEDAAPNNGDGNNDSIPDSQQNNVVSVLMPDGNYVTIAEQNGCAIHVELAQNLPPDGNNSIPFPYDFEVDCPNAEIVTYHHGVIDLEQHQYRQYVPTNPGEPNTIQWQDLPVTYDTVNIQGQPVSTATFTLTDGELGDHTIVDGKIFHTSGLAITPDRVQFSLPDYTVDELGHVATIIVSRFGKCQGRVTVDYATQENTATQEQDYTQTKGMLTWGNGECSDKTFSVTIRDDLTPEGNETVTLNLSNPTGGANITTPTATLTIIDNDLTSSSETSESCYKLPTCQVCCPTCQLYGQGSELKVKSLTTIIKVGETEKMTFADGTGELLIKEIPNHTFVSLDAWKPLTAGAGEVTLTGVKVGETKMVITDSAAPLQTLTIYITVIEGDADAQPVIDIGDDSPFRIKALHTNILVNQSLDLTVAGGEGELAISEIPDPRIVLLTSWTPLGETGTANFTLTGVSVGHTKIVISDRANPPQKTTINVTVIETDNTDEPDTGETEPPDDSETTTCQNAFKIDALGNYQGNSPACFTGKISVDGLVQPNHTRLTNMEAKTVRLTTNVIIEKAHVNQVAEVLLVGIYNAPEINIAYTRDEKAWQVWNSRIDGLPTAQYYPQITQEIEVFIFEGNLSSMPGEFTVFAGYRLANGTIIYNGLNPLHFWVDPPTNVEPPVTEIPVVEPPVTEIPVVEPPVTEIPVVEPPVTEIPEPPVEEPICQANALVIDSQGQQQVSNSACFNMELKIGHVRQASGNRLTHSQSKTIILSANVIVDSSHVGQAANILLLGVFNSTLNNASYTRNGQTWQRWDENISNLPSAQFYSQLPDTVQLEVLIYEGDLSSLPGKFTLFIGYRLEDGTIVYNGIEPLHFAVSNSTSFDLRQDTPKTLTSNDIQATSIFEPFIHNQEGKIGNSLIFDYHDTLTVSAFVEIEPRHVGQAADILMVASYFGNFTQIPYSRNGSTWQVWDNRLDSLSPVQHYSQLPEKLEIPIYLGSLKGIPGDFIVHIGYRLADGVIVFNGFTPLRLVIANGVQVDASGQRIPTFARFISWAFQKEGNGNLYQIHFTDSVDLATTIIPEPQHLGQSADILMVALRRDWGNPFVDIQTQVPLWGTWEKSLIHSQATIPNVTLETILKEIRLFENSFTPQPGHYLIYVGYRLANGNIIYNGGEPLRLEVSK